MENIEELKEHVKFVTNLCMPGSGLEEHFSTFIFNGGFINQGCRICQGDFFGN